MQLDLSRFSDRFRQETRAQLGRINNTIGELVRTVEEGEALPVDQVAELLRTVHSIKGAARMMGYHLVDKLCHQIEELLGAIRTKGHASVDALGVLTTASDCVDRLIGMEPGDPGGSQDYPEWVKVVLAGLKAHLSEIDSVATVARASSKVAGIEVSAREDAGNRGAPPVTAGLISLRVDVSALDSLLQAIRELTHSTSGLKSLTGEIEALKSFVNEAVSADGGSVNSSLLTEVKRQLAGLSQLAGERTDRVSQQVRDLDQHSTAMRMRPLEDLFHLLPGQVAELAKSVGKKVRIDFVGGNIRLDGRIVEQLSEPLMHLIRNAVDHGLETPDQRQQAGKHAEGWIWIGALENAGWVRITVADDGGGIDLRQIWQRAAELNLTDILEPPPTLIKRGYQFLFDDRFSSRRKVTRLSGRGVGLAAVKRRVQELQGDISVESEPGLVTRFILTIPESLSSRRQVIVALKRGVPDSGLLAIPLGMVQLVRRSNHTEPGDEDNDNDNTSQVMPVVSLAELFDGVEADAMKSDADCELILSDGIRSVRAIVTDIVAEAEMVVEPLPGLIQPIPLIAGITVWSDDRILPVLNVPALLNQVYISLTKEQTALKHEG